MRSCCQVELVAKQHQTLSIPMMAEVLSWRARVVTEPVAAPLVHILDRCTERLLALFERYVHDLVRCTRFRDITCPKCFPQALRHLYLSVRRANNMCSH
jgi:hypothetical protein